MKHMLPHIYIKMTYPAYQNDSTWRYRESGVQLVRWRITSCDVELMLKVLPVEDLLKRELFLSPVRLPNFFMIRNESSNLTSSRSLLLFRSFCLDAAEQSHPFLSTRCWDSCTAAWRLLLSWHGDRFWGSVEIVFEAPLSLRVLPPKWTICFLKVAVCGSGIMKTSLTMPFQSCSSSSAPYSPAMAAYPRTTRDSLIFQGRSESPGLETTPIGDQEQPREWSLPLRKLTSPLPLPNLNCAAEIFLQTQMRLHLLPLPESCSLTPRMMRPSIFRMLWLLLLQDSTRSVSMHLPNHRVYRRWINKQSLIWLPKQQPPPLWKNFISPLLSFSSLFHICLGLNALSNHGRISLP